MSTVFLVSYVVLWGIVMVLSFVALDYLRRNRPRQKKLGLQEQGTAVGKRPEKLELTGSDGQKVALDAGKRMGTVLLFTAKNCSACQTLYPVLEPFAKKYPQVEIVMAAIGSVEEARATAEKHGLSFPVCPSSDKEFAEFGVSVFPFAYLLAPDGTVLSKGGVAGGSAYLELLLRSAQQVQPQAQQQQQQQQPQPPAAS